MNWTYESAACTGTVDAETVEQAAAMAARQIVNCQTSAGGLRVSALQIGPDRFVVVRRGRLGAAFSLKQAST